MMKKTLFGMAIVLALAATWSIAAGHYGAQLDVVERQLRDSKSHAAGSDAEIPALEAEATKWQRLAMQQGKVLDDVDAQLEQDKVTLDLARAAIKVYQERDRVHEVETLNRKVENAALRSRVTALDVSTK